MITAAHAALVAVGGAAGSVLRYVVANTLAKGSAFVGTLSVNLAGSFLLGFLVFATPGGAPIGPSARMLLAVGVLGGFTTMSAFAGETVVMMQGDGLARAGAYVLATMVGSLVAAWLGRAAALAVWG